jgi:hypothetical protein
MFIPDFVEPASIKINSFNVVGINFSYKIYPFGYYYFFSLSTAYLGDVNGFQTNLNSAVIARPELYNENNANGYRAIANLNGSLTIIPQNTYAVADAKWNDIGYIATGLVLIANLKLLAGDTTASLSTNVKFGAIKEKYVRSIIK